MLMTIAVLSTAQKIASLFQGTPEELVTMIIAMVPIAELRGAIPWALTLGRLEWYQAFPLAVVGNMVPVPFLLLFLGAAETFLTRHIPIFERFFAWLWARTRKRSGLIEKYGAIALVLFVGIPLPITGAWTGCAASYLLKIPFWKAMLFIFFGVLLSATIVTTVMLSGLQLFSIFLNR